VADEKEFDIELTNVKRYVDPFEPVLTDTQALRKQVIDWLDNRIGVHGE